MSFSLKPADLLPILQKQKLKSYSPNVRAIQDNVRIVYPAVSRHVLESAYFPNGIKVCAFQDRIPLMYSVVNIGCHFKFSQVVIFQKWTGVSRLRNEIRPQNTLGEK